MALTLLQKLKNMTQRLERQHTDIIQALETKGVVVTNDVVNADIADLIRQIYVSDWELFFNFKDVDQFGQPRTLQSGQATGGLTIINPYMDEIVVSPISNMTHTYTPVAPAIGVWGNQGRMREPIVVTVHDITLYTNFDFKDEPVISKELTYYDDTLN